MIFGSKKKTEYKVEYLHIAPDSLTLVGWRLKPSDTIRLSDKNGTVAATIATMPRPDVADAFGVDGDQCGFLVRTADYDFDTLQITVGSDKTKTSVSNVHRSESLPDICVQYLSAVGAPPTGQPLKGTSASPSKASLDFSNLARGYIEGAYVVPNHPGAYIFGWLTQSCDGQWVFANQDGTVHIADESEFYFYLREDVTNAFPDFSHRQDKLGFITYVDGIDVSDTLTLSFQMPDGTISEIHQVSVPELPAKRADALKTILSLNTPLTEYALRFKKVDWKILDNMCRRHNQLADETTVEVKSFGTPSSSPEVSIIVPLYGRYDFVEHQLMEFSKSSYVIDNVEIVYVVDDPAIYSLFKAEADHFFQLHKVPFKWVWGGVNRGFAGANNLGARHSKGDILLFMNSDVFPKTPHWCESLMATLKNSPSAGVVAPRLLFADGGIQHAGMTNRWLPQLSVWINHHVNMGIDPELDPVKTAKPVDLVTGACMMMQRQVFEEVGAWHDRYIIGDYEDSDLCFALKDRGYEAIYDPTVEMYHLERQSFRDIGHDDFRTRVMLANATKHQTRWDKYLEAEPG